MARTGTAAVKIKKTVRSRSSSVKEPVAPKKKKKTVSTKAPKASPVKKAVSSRVRKPKKMEAKAPKVSKKSESSVNQWFGPVLKWLGVSAGVGVAAVGAFHMLNDLSQVHRQQQASAHPQQQQQERGPFQKEFAAAQMLPAEHRIAYWSELLAGNEDFRTQLADYQGPPIDGDMVPWVPHTFDCTTFVETVAALSRSQSMDDFYGHLRDIRYRGSDVAYLNRNHFPEADWIPNNVQAGILSDVTRSMAESFGVSWQTERKKIDRLAWLNKQTKEGRFPASVAVQPDARWSVPVEASVDYLPIDEAVRFASKIPDGTILNIVRRNSPRQPVLITHQGFVLQRGGVTYFRHATPDGQIRIAPLEQYLENQSKTKWPAVGVNLGRLN